MVKRGEVVVVRAPAKVKKINRSHGKKLLQLCHQAESEHEGNAAPFLPGDLFVTAACQTLQE